MVHVFFGFSGFHGSSGNAQVSEVASLPGLRLQGRLSVLRASGLSG